MARKKTPEGDKPPSKPLPTSAAGLFAEAYGTARELVMGKITPKEANQRCREMEEVVAAARAGVPPEPPPPAGRAGAPAGQAQAAGQLLAGLRARGLTLRANGQGQLVASPPSGLTDEDRGLIRANKPALLALLEEEAKVGQEVRPRGKAIVPRSDLERQSPEWVEATLSHLRRCWEDRGLCDDHAGRALQQLREQAAWLRYPPGKPYGSLEAMLLAEVGEGARALLGAAGGLDLTVPPRSAFDYSGLAEDTRAALLERAAEIRGRERRVTEDLVAIGRALIDVKGRLPEGRFDEWLRAEFGWGRSSAYRFISVAERFGEVSSQIGTIAPSALYLLAEAGTPEEAREEAVGKAAAGERVTHTAAKAIVDRHKPPAPRKPRPTAPEPPPARVVALEVEARPTAPPPAPAGQEEVASAARTPAKGVQSAEPPSPVEVWIDQGGAVLPPLLGRPCPDRLRVRLGSLVTLLQDVIAGRDGDGDGDG